VILVFRDVSTRRRSEQTRERLLRAEAEREAAVDASRAKDEFLAVLSHELRNPLAGMLGWVEVLRGRGLPPDQVARAIDGIERSAQQQKRLVNDLLDVSRIVAGRLSVERAPVDWNALVAASVEAARAECEARGLGLSYAGPSGTVLVLGDAQRLVQVVENLLSNAAKFTPAGGAATVSLAGEGRVAVLTVADTGCGIEPALLPRVFEPFVQAERTLDRAGGGLGLGLALSRGLVELHGGDIEARSDGQGRGTTFVVRLPLDARAEAAPGDASAAAGAQGRRRVLVIDDDRDVANGLKLALEIDAHEVAVAYDGDEGLELARDFKPDFVLCDVGMPGMDGYEVARAFRADPALRTTFLVALTGFAQAADRARARQAGFDEHLAKPANMAAINTLLAR